MAGPEFFLTGMGRMFFEGTMPSLVRELKKLNQNLEKLIELQQGEEKCQRCGSPMSNKGLCRGEDRPHESTVKNAEG